MKNFDWNEFRENKIAVHCDTEEKAEDFLKQCHNMEMTWRSGFSLLDWNFWDYYKENTCYHNSNDLWTTDLDYYKENHYKIIEWEIEEDFNSILEEALNSPTLSEVEKYGKELKSIKIYEYNDEQYIIIKKGKEIVKFDKYED